MGGAQYRGGVQYRGGYHDKCGGYLEYRGGCSVPWGISLVPWRVILSTVGEVQYRGGCSVPWGESFVIWVPHGTDHLPRYSWYPPTYIMISPHGTQISKDGIPPRNWTPPRYWAPPTVLHTHYTGWFLAAFSCNFIFKLLNKTFSKLKTKRNILMNTVSKK